MKKRHEVLLVLSILSLITFLDRIAISSAGEHITKDLGLSTAQWGWILGIFTLSYGAFEVPSGLLGDKIGAKKVLIRVVLWWSAFTVLTGFSTGFWSLFLIRFLFGIGEAGAYPNISIALAKWFPSTERGRAQAIIWAASRLGAALTPLLVIPIQRNFGWEVSFYVLGLAGALWVIFWAFWYNEEPAQAKDISENELQEILSKRQLDDHTSRSFFSFLKHKNLWLLLIMYFCYASGAYFFQGWLPKYLQRGKGFSEEELKMVTSLPFLFAAAGCLTGGFLSDKCVNRFGRTTGRRIIPVLGLSVSGILLIACALTDNKEIALIFLSVGGAFMDFTAPVSWAVAMDIGGKSSGTISGAMNTAGLTGAYITTVSFGYLATSFNYNTPVWLIGGMLLFGSILWFWIDAEKKLT